MSSKMSIIVLFHIDNLIMHVDFFCSCCVSMLNNWSFKRLELLFNAKLLQLR